MDEDAEVQDPYSLAARAAQRVYWEHYSYLIEDYNQFISTLSGVFGKLIEDERNRVRTEEP